MVKLYCKVISDLECFDSFIFKEEDETYYIYLTHYNEMHDPQFVAKCLDDLLVEYQDLIVKITSLVS